MAGPFKMKAGKEGPMKKNFEISPVKQENMNIQKFMKLSNKIRRGQGKKVSYKSAWDAMTAAEKAKHGSFSNFTKAAKDYNKKNPGGAPKPKTIL